MFISLDMVKTHFEDIKSDFDGTIIDIETIGEFTRGSKDSREYKEIIPVIFGFINKEGLNVYCAENEDAIAKLKDDINKMLPDLKRPFYAFNTDFERGVLFNHLGEPVLFDGELNKEKYERKRDTVRLLRIPQYDDPFNDSGLACKEAWLAGDIENSILHNRSCLLKERDILLKRSFRKPEELRLVP